MPSSSLDLSGWAGDIISEMEIPVTTGSVVSWLQGNVGNLNLALRTDYLTVDSGIVSDSSQSGMLQSEIAVYNKMYECFYLSKRALQASQSGFSDWIEIDGKDQGSIRKVSKSELAKELRANAKDCAENLNQIIKWYRKDGPNPESNPLQVYPLNIAPEPPPFISGVFP